MCSAYKKDSISTLIDNNVHLPFSDLSEFQIADKTAKVLLPAGYMENYMQVNSNMTTFVIRAIFSGLEKSTKYMTYCYTTRSVHNAYPGK